MTHTYEDVANDTVASAQEKGIEGGVDNFRQILSDKIAAYKEILAKGDGGMSTEYLKEYVEISEGVIELFNPKRS